MAQASASCSKRPARPELDIRNSASGGVSIGSPHSDTQGWSDQITDAAFGTQSRDFSAAMIAQLETVVRDRGETVAPSPRMNAAMAVMGAVQPQDELEAVLSVQLAAGHMLAMDLMMRAKHADTREGINDYVNALAKVQRTWTANMEALTKRRTGGKQQMEVRHVYIDARQQHLHAGGGGEQETLGQPYGPSPALRSPDALGLALQSPGGAEQAPLPTARRGDGLGSAERAQERQLEGRALLGGDDGAAPDRG